MSRPEPLPPGVGGTLHHREPPPGTGQVVVCGSELVQADPVVLMSGALLALWHQHGTPPVAELECSDTCPIGDVIRLNGITRRAVYTVIGTYRDWPETFVIRWPD